MPQTPKKRPERDEEMPDEADKSAWSKDQKRREYYYDDAHGYEVYKPEDEEGGHEDGDEPA